jgi:hypothetical protein
MAIIKKIAFAGLLSMAGLVVYRFARIVARAVFEKPAKARTRRA